jgi:hypothetical protein
MSHGQFSSETATERGGRQTGQEARLPLRDWIVLPIIGVLTLCFLAASTEWIARRTFSTGIGSLPSCAELPDYSKGARVAPNTVCWGKLAEGGLTEYRFNSCGDRAGMECGPKTPGAFRIVLIGYSMALGRYVAREDTFAALLPAELSRLAGRRVEVYNEGMMWGYLNSVNARFDDALAAKPDMILWALTPIDFKYPAFVSNEAVWHGLDKPDALPNSAGKPGSIARLWYRFKTAFSTGSIAAFVRQHFDRTQTTILLRHYLYKSQSLYVRSFLMGGEEAEFLRTAPSTEWQEKLRQFDKDAADAAARSRAAGVPFAVVLVPNRAQAAMFSMSNWPVGYNPYKLGGEMHTIVTSHGGIYIDILPDFRNIPNPEQYYFPVDGHPNAEGHRIVSGLLASALTSGAVPALSGAAQPQAPQAQGR